MLKYLLIGGLVLLGAGSGYGYVTSHGDAAATAPENGNITQLAEATKTAGTTALQEMRYDLAKVQEILETLGYSHIRFASNKPPHYQVDACRGATQMRLTVNTWGEIVKRRKSGRCTSATTTAQRPATAEPDDQTSPLPAQQDGADRGAENKNGVSKLGQLLGDIINGENPPVQVDDEGVRVNVPTTNVEVSEDRVRVRAPFVNIDIPRR